MLSHAVNSKNIRVKSLAPGAKIKGYTIHPYHLDLWVWGPYRQHPPRTTPGQLCAFFSELTHYVNILTLTVCDECMRVERRFAFRS